MSDRKTRGLAWLYAAAITAVMFVCMFMFLDVRFAVNDDAATLHMFQGYMSGEPAHFHIYLHGLLVWPLYWLGCLAPTVPWYTYLQLILLFVSCVVIAKSLMQIFARHGCPLWLGAIMAASVLGCLCLKSAARITYTQTAAILGMASVVQLYSIEHDRPGWVIAGVMGSLALLVLAYSLRQLTALPILAACGLSFVYLFCCHYGFGKKAKRSAKPMVISLLVVALVMGGMAGLRELEIELNGQREHLEWQQARIALLDYHDLSQLPQEAVDAAGWSPAVLEMLKEWSFLDSSVTTESFQRALEVVESMDERTFGQRLQDAWQVFGAAIENNPEEVRCLALALIAALACLGGAMLAPENRGRLLGAVLAFAGLLAAMLLYLSLQGRLPARALLMAVLPVAGALFGLLPACLPRRKAAVVVILCAVYAVSCIAHIVPGLLKDEEAEATLGNAMADLEEYALWDPECLYIYDQTLVGADLRAFPEYPDGVPDNVTFWGGWTYRSAQSEAQFERFGIDLDELDPEAFINGDIYIASGRIDPQPVLVQNWLSEKLGYDVQCEYWSEYGTVYIFCFY